jgi:hypothetical protein
MSVSAFVKLAAANTVTFSSASVVWLIISKTNAKNNLMGLFLIMIFPNLILFGLVSINPNVY